jgi:hypothetical protein
VASRRRIIDFVSQNALYFTEEARKTMTDVKSAFIRGGYEIFMKVYKLFCKSILVGLIKYPFSSDNTWYGIFDVAITPARNEFADRILYFINYLKNWHDRLLSPEDPAAAPELDQFDDLINHSCWTVETSSGDCHQLDNAPVFYAEEISWRIKSYNSEVAN